MVATGSALVLSREVTTYDRTLLDSSAPARISRADVNASDHLVLSTRQIADCLVNNQELSFVASSGVISVLNLSFDSHGLIPQHSKCNVQVNASDSGLISLHLNSNTCNEDTAFEYILSEADKARTTPIFRLEECSFLPLPLNETVYVNTAFRFRLSLKRSHTNRRPFGLTISFTVLPESHAVLQVHMYSPFNGSVCTPNWDGVSVSLMTSDTWVSLTCPVEYTVMVSAISLGFYLSGNFDDNKPCDYYAFVGLYEYRAMTEPVRVFCWKKIHSPWIHSPRSGVLYIRAASFRVKRVSTGFKLLFSFHRDSDMLPQLPGGRWNCSLSIWPQFRHHFRCNVYAECVNLEDEALCPYTSTHCGEGRLTIGESCYLLTVPRMEPVIGEPFGKPKSGTMTWEMAEKKCQREGGHLMSLNSISEWQMITDLLRIVNIEPIVFLGLMQTIASLPTMYRNMWIYLDGTVNHFMKRPDIAWKTGCTDDISVAFIYYYQVIVESRTCRRTFTSALCDVPAVGTNTLIQDMPFTSAPTVPSLNWQKDHFWWNHDRFYSRCPGGHFTHTFLACDFQSRCWVEDFSTSASCSAPLTPLPPSMACDSGNQRVPYTLVCDHHPDCYDRSDEDFCVFIPCDINTQTECSDKSCLYFDHECDGIVHCRDASDERKCSMALDFPLHYIRQIPAFLLFDGVGGTNLEPLTRYFMLYGRPTEGRLVNATLTGATLSGETFVNGTLIDGILHNATLVGGAVEGATLVSGTLESRRDGTLVNKTLTGGTKVYGVLLSGTLISGTLISGAMIREEMLERELFLTGTVMEGIVTGATVVDGVMSCPDTHFQCADRDYCIPVFMLCNHVYDCPDHDDEANCDSYQCPGFYRCRGAKMCVHRRDVCDGLIHCPQNDDELLCDLTCPYGCTCHGLAFFCSRVIPVALYPQLRYLDASGSGMSPTDVINNTMLVYLSLAGCKLTNWGLVTLPSLRSLDFSDNNVTELTSQFFRHLPKLRNLMLIRNPLIENFLSDLDSSHSIPTIRTLDLSGVLLAQLSGTMLNIFPNLHVLNVTGCGLDRVLDDGFQHLHQLRVLDLRGSPLTYFPRDVFHGLVQLKNVYADNFRLCCLTTLPSGFNQENCEAPSDEVSSCDALLRSDFLRICLYLFASLSCIGNLSSLVFRMRAGKDKRRTGFDVFVANLCVSDFLMGVFLAIVGVADRVYLGAYLWEDIIWRLSTSCKIAGFLSLLSNEMSAFVICLITLDRFLVLRFPFSQLRFSPTTAFIASAVSWVICIAIAAVPLLPMMSHWQFYGQTGICIPLPITRTDFEGREYSFNIMIVLNFVLFVAVALGQLLVYMSVQKHKMPSIGDSTPNAFSKDQALARRLITVAASDFLCWFPIGLIGMMADYGYQVPGEVNVAMAVFVLPLNSAINPFLYTLNIILERLRVAREKRLKQFLLSKIQAQGGASSGNAALWGGNCTRDEAVRFVKQWVDRGILSREFVSRCLPENEDISLATDRSCNGK